MSTTPTTSSSVDKLDANPFARSSNILRSPIIKSNLQLQHQQMETQTLNEIAASQEKEYAVSDTAIIEKLNSFEKLCETLQKQVDDLKLENQRLKDSLMKNVKSHVPLVEIPTEIVYHTDEEELAQETE